jgi:hypothetical protein
MTCSVDLDFRNAIKADLDRNMPDSASVDSRSPQHCLPFQFLEPRHAIGQQDEDGVAVQCLPDMRNLVE